MTSFIKINKILKIIIISSLFLLTIGLTYSYFIANIIGSEIDTTITVSGGSMNIIYNSEATISVNNITPRTDAWGGKNIFYNRK